MSKKAMFVLGLACGLILLVGLGGTLVSGRYTMGAGAVGTHTQRMTLASDDPAVTALQLMDNPVVVHDAAASASGTQVMLAYDSTLPTAVTADADAARALGDEFGRARTGWEGDKWQGSVQSADASSTEAVIKAGTSAKKIAVLWLKVHCDVALDVTLEDEDNAVLDVAYVAAKGGYVIIFPPGSPLRVNTADKAFQIQTSGAGNVSASAGGYLYP